MGVPSQESECRNIRVVDDGRVINHGRIIARAPRVASALIPGGGSLDAREIYRAQAAPDDIEAFLETRANAVLATLNRDGSIHLAFMIFLFEEGKMFFETSSTTVKARNIAARPQASFAVDGDGFMAMAQGTARLIHGEEAHSINGRLRAKYLTEAAAVTVGNAWGQIDDVAIEVTPTRWRSWSNAKFGQFSMEAAEGLHPREWWKQE